MSNINTSFGSIPAIQAGASASMPTGNTPVETPTQLRSQSTSSSSLVPPSSIDPPALSRRQDKPVPSLEATSEYVSIKFPNFALADYHPQLRSEVQNHMVLEYIIGGYRDGDAKIQAEKGTFSIVTAGSNGLDYTRVWRDSEVDVREEDGMEVDVQEAGINIAPSNLQLTVTRASDVTVVEEDPSLFNDNDSDTSASYFSDETRSSFDDFVAEIIIPLIPQDIAIKRDRHALTRHYENMVSGEREFTMDDAFLDPLPQDWKVVKCWDNFNHTGYCYRNKITKHKPIVRPV